MNRVTNRRRRSSNRLPKDRPAVQIPLPAAHPGTGTLVMTPDDDGAFIPYTYWSTEPSAHPGALVVFGEHGPEVVGFAER